MFGFSSQRTPFSPAASPNWGFQTSAPNFGVPPASSPFSAPPSTGGFGFGAQTSTGLFSSSLATSQPFSWSFQSQPASTPPTWTPQPPKRNAFREDFYRAVTRRDKRPLTTHTRLAELEEPGVNALKLIQQELVNYKSTRDAIFKEPWFQRNQRPEELKQGFDRELSDLRASMSEHEMDVELFNRNICSAYPRSDVIDKAIRDADHVASQLEKMADARSQENGHMFYPTNVPFDREFRVPHEFIVSHVEDLKIRLDRLLQQVRDLEKLKKTDVPSSGSNDPLDIRPFDRVRDISDRMATAIEKLEAEVERKKEEYRTRLRREETVRDPFAEAELETRIRENEVYYVLRQKHTPLLQPTYAAPTSMPTTTPLLTSGAAMFQPSFPASSPFAASSTPLFAPPATSGFGSTGFGAFSTGGNSLFGQSGSNTLFGQSGFGTTSSGAGFGFGQSKPAFASPGSSVGTTFGSTSWGASPGGRFGFKASGNRSL